MLLQEVEWRRREGALCSRDERRPRHGYNGRKFLQDTAARDQREGLELNEEGWEFFDRMPDKWSALFRKDFSSAQTHEAVRAEVRRIMGDYWFEPPPPD